jgi:urease accessory protein
LIRGLSDFALPTHLLAVVALGLLAGQHAARFPLLVLIELAAGVLAGSLAIAMGLGENPAAIALLALAVLCAAGVIVARPIPVPIIGLLGFAVGIALALNAPPQEITRANAIVAQAGLAVAALAVFALIGAITMHATRPWQGIGVRIVAAWIAASAILVLALRLRGS